MLKKGWVKLHRGIQENVVWTSTTPEQFKIFIALLMMVNHYPNSWEHEGKKMHLQPGQTITSVKSIVEACGPGITPQKVKTALKKFEKWGILTNKSTNKHRLITLINWDFYQGSDEKLTSNLTSNQPATNQQLTTKGECNNVIMEENNSSSDDEINESKQFNEFWENYPRKKEKQAALTKWKTCIKEDTPEDIITAAKNYATECQNKEARFVKLAKTFLGPDKHYREYINQPEEPKRRSHMTREEQVAKGLLEPLEPLEPEEGKERIMQKYSHFIE